MNLVLCLRWHLLHWAVCYGWRAYRMSDYILKTRRRYDFSLHSQNIRKPPAMNGIWRLLNFDSPVTGKFSHRTSRRSSAGLGEVRVHRRVMVGGIISVGNRRGERNINSKRICGVAGRVCQAQCKKIIILYVYIIISNLFQTTSTLKSYQWRVWQSFVAEMQQNKLLL